MAKLRILGLAALALATTLTLAPTAQAMPIAAAQALLAAGAEATVSNVAWVCGPYGCRHVYRRPAFYGGPFYGRPRYFGGPDYGRHHGWHRGGWHRGW